MRVGPRTRRPSKGLATLALVVSLAVVAGGLLARWGSPNPFSTKTTDRSQPVLLRSIQNLSLYRAATANFQVLIDLEKTTPFIPRLIKGERTLFVAAGSVDAEVDFSRLGRDAVRVSGDRQTAWITLPHASLSPVRFDTDHSYVASRKRGVLDRIGSVFADNATSEQQLFHVAKDKLEAAALQSGVLPRAEQNTRAMLQGMLGSLGYTNVVVTFTGPPVQK